MQLYCFAEAKIIDILVTVMFSAQFGCGIALTWLIKRLHCGSFLIDARVLAIHELVTGFSGRSKAVALTFKDIKSKGIINKFFNFNSVII